MTRATFGQWPNFLKEQRSDLVNKQDIYNFTGRTINQRFLLTRFIDEGGMGIVYEATDLLINRSVAVKILHPRFLNRPKIIAPYLELFNREGAVLKQLRHKNIVSIYDMGTDGNISFIAMELLHGQNLEDRIHQGVLRPEHASALLLQIAEALDYAHGRKIVHLDIKSANIFLLPSDGEFELVKVIDFGLARIIQSTFGHTLSRVVGTPQYTAPEVYQNQASSLSDVYSLGVVTFEMLTGVLPFSNTQIYSLIADHINNPPPSVSTYCRELTKFNEDLLTLALAKRPTERPHSAGMFARHFAHGLSEEGPLIVMEKVPVLRKTVVYLDNPFLGKKRGSAVASFLSFLILVAPFVTVGMWFMSMDYGYLSIPILGVVYAVSLLLVGYKILFQSHKWNQMSWFAKIPIISLIILPAALLSPFLLVALIVYFLSIFVGGNFYRNHRARIIEENRTTARLE